MRHHRFLAPLLLLAAVAFPQVSEATVYVTELLALNVSTLTDEDGAFSDWIELYNANAAPIDLGGWYLTDDASLPTKWQLPTTVIPAGDYLVVFASDKNRAVSGAELHTNFKLSGGGEYLALVRADGATIEHAYAPSFPAQIEDISWGLAVDLAQQRCFVDPTPGAANDESPSCGVVEALSFSSERGFYDAPFNVSIATSSPGASIYYTLDGSAPSSTNGLLYSTPIPIPTTTTLRAIAYAPPLLPTPAVTHTYLFLDDVVRQTGAGYPTAGFLADYEMDTKVVDDPRYAGTIRGDLRTLPTIAIAMSVDDLFGPELGIYSHPQKRGSEWERPASAELIFPDGSTGFEINCGVRIQGRLSRVKNPKKSLRLAFKSEYGPPALEYPLFSDTPVTRFNKLRLRASHNKSWSFGIQRADYIRDQWARDTQIAMGQVASHGSFFHVYLNGLYWGLYNVVELPEAEFAVAYYGGLEEEWDVLEPAETDSGTRDAWKAALDIAKAGVSTPAGYAALGEYIDYPNLIDYMLTNFHAGTTDWDESNWYAARRRLPGEGFHFFSWDAEQSMELVNMRRTGVHNSGMPSQIYTALRQNAEFRLLFADHAHRHLFDDGVLTPEMARERYMDRVAEIDRAVVAESARWGDPNNRIDPFDRDTDWVREIEWLRLAYFPQRTAMLLAELRSVDLYPSTDAPTMSPSDRYYPAGSSVLLSASPGIVYFTLDGSDPRLPGGGVSGTASVYAAPIPLAGELHVRARALDGSEWSALSERAYTPDIALRVSEIMYHPIDPVPPSTFEDDDFEFLELVNVSDAAIDLTGVRISEGISFTFASGALAPSARILVVRNQAAFESRYGTGLPIAGEYSSKLANEGERIHVETALGYEILEFIYDDAWVPATDGGDRSLVPSDLTAERRSWSRRTGWAAGAVDGGTPGTAEPAECVDGIDNDADGTTDLADAHCEDASDDREAAPPVDAFVCYSARASAGSDGAADATISLTDSIETARSFEISDIDGFCTPAVIDGDTAVVDPATHLASFKLRAADGAPSPLLADVLVESVGPIYVDTFQPDRFLEPAAVDESAPVTTPDDGAHALDRYKCHRVKPAHNSPAYFPRQLKLRAESSLDSRIYDFKRPSRLCNPVSVDGGPVKNPAGPLFCYQARRSRDEARHSPRLGVYVASGLISTRVDTREVVEICAPAF